MQHSYVWPLFKFDFTLATPAPAALINSSAAYQLSPYAGGAFILEVLPMFERIVFLIAAFATIAAFALDVWQAFSNRKTDDARKEESRH